MRLELEEPRSAPRVVGRAGVGGGPAGTLIVVGGVHGNEPAGLEAATNVLGSVAGTDGWRGSMVALAGHTRALGVDDGLTRYIDADLNRLFTPELVEARCLAEADPDGPPRPAECVEAVGLLGAIDHEIAIARGPVVLIDLHTTSSPSRPFIAMEDSLPARRVVRMLPLPVILGMEEELRGLLFDYVSNNRRVVSFVVEGGSHTDPASVRVHESVIRVLLDGLGVLPGAAGAEDQARLIASAGPLRRAVFDVRHREPVALPDFSPVDGAESFGRVRRGRTRIATQGGEDLIAPLDGVLFMPNRQPLKRPGDDGYFIVREVGRGWIELSARLRRQRWIRAALPRVLPGVRTLAGDTDELVVAPEIAAVLMRQFFHLLGYRLIRHSPIPHLSRPARAWRGMRAFVRSLGVMFGGIARGGERGLFPEPRDTDWIVSRRTLDRERPDRG